MNSFDTPARIYAPGMGDAVADRTINRKLDPTTRIQLSPLPPGTIDARPYVRETWAEVARRVAEGNASLDPLKGVSQINEFHAMHHHLRQASLLMSGRHLQHGDRTQSTRPQEVFTNCSTAPATFLSFYLLLNGSGVGRAYDNAMMAVDWSLMPVTVPVIDQTHADVQSGDIKFLDARHAAHFYRKRRIITFMVPDSREGWAQGIERMEEMAYTGFHRDSVLLLDYSGVRCKGSPIRGMQDRPASGPLPLMVAIANMSKLREANMERWRSTAYADHYAAECVLVGGARRAARMATKTWRDKNVLDFIKVKQGGFLWSANNSVTVDAEFWERINLESETPRDLTVHAKRVFDAVCEASYGTGEPGFINVDKLNVSTVGLESYRDGDFAGNSRYKIADATKELMGDLAGRFLKSPNKAIVNPCGEIPLSMLGGYCVIADVVPFHSMPDGTNEHFETHAEREAWFYSHWDDDAESAFMVATRALMRTNLMEALYGREVRRTNRIGVGMTGVHEYAWERFGYGWKDLTDPDISKSLPFWLMLSRFSRAVQAEAESYAVILGVAVPDTCTTMKPAGTTSKLWGLTEGGHLPSMLEFLRWVQFRSDDPLIEEYKAKGYPVRELQTYGGTTIVGFPTQPTICTLGMGDKLVTAAEATPEEQYRWVQRLEKYYLRGVREDGVTPMSPDRSGQVSYTLKYDQKVLSFDEFKRTLLEGQSKIKCCSVMPQGDTSSYEYLPETPVNKAEYEAIAEAIERAGKMQEDVDFAHVDCESGACPIDFNKKAA